MPARARTKEATAAAARASRPTPAALDIATREIERLKREIGKSYFELGGWLNKVKDEELYKVRHETFEGYLHVEVDIDRTLAYRYMRIARAFSAEVAAAHGPAKLDAYLRLMDATLEEERPQDVRAAAVPVPVVAKARKEAKGARGAKGARAGAARVKSLAEATSREVLEAAKDARAAAGRTRKGPAVPAAVARLVAKATKALAATKAKGATLTARPARTEAAGGAILDLRGLPVAAAAKAFGALAQTFRS